MTARAILRGLRLALASPGLLAFLWAASMLVALPAGLAMRGAITRQLGDSAAHEEIRGELELSWLGELHHGGGELEKSLTPLRLSPFAPLENLEGWAGGRLFDMPPALLAAGGLVTLGWVLVLGGLIERYAAGGGRFRLGPLLAAGVHAFPRILGLTILSVPLYWGVYRLARLGFGWLEETTRDVTVERTVLLWYLGAWVLVVALLVAVHTVFGLAKVAAVVESRRNPLRALVRGARFAIGHPVRAFGVELGLAAVGLAVVATYAILAPSPSGASVASILWAFAWGQVYIVARLVQRLALCAAWTTIYLESGTAAGR